MIDILSIFAVQIVAGNQDQDAVTVIIAMLIAIAGPFAGTYMFLKSSNKIFGTMAGLVSKAGAGARGWASGYAKEKQARSIYGQVRQRRKEAGNAVASERAYNQLKKHPVLAGLGMSKDARQIMQTQATAVSDKLHQERVARARQDVSKVFRNQDRDSGAGEKDTGLKRMAVEAANAARRGDQITFDAFSSHAAAGGADEYRMYHEELQKLLDPKHNAANEKMFNNSMAFVSATMGGDLSSKNPSLATVLQQQDSTVNIKEHMYNDAGMRQKLNKINAEAHSKLSSDEAKAGAKFISDKTLIDLVTNPNYSLGDGARKAYEAEYKKLQAGTREFKNGVATAEKSDGTRVILPSLEYQFDDKGNPITRASVDLTVETSPDQDTLPGF